MTVKEITQVRSPDGSYLIDFNNKYLQNVVVKHGKARVDNKVEGVVRTNAVGDLLMGASLHCLMSVVEDRLPRYVVVKEMRGSAIDTENKDEEILEFNVEVSVGDEHVAELDKVIKYLNENGCGMMRMLKKTGMFKVIYNVKKIEA